MNINKNKPNIILVAGASASGKSTISKWINDFLIDKGYQSITLCQDRYYKINKNQTNNYDHPNAFDWVYLQTDLNKIINNIEVYFPVYDYVTKKRSYEPEPVPTNVDFIVIEGLFSLFDDQINDTAILKVFVDTCLDECLIRRIKRDILERGRSIESIIDQWKTTVRPMYERFVLPTKTKADIIIPWNQTNDTALKFIGSALASLGIK